MDQLNPDDPIETSSPEGLKERLGLLRGDLGYGKKLNRRGLAAIASYAPVSIHHYDQTTEETTIETVQQMGPILDDNVDQYNSGHDGYSPSRDLKKVASIPLIEVDRLYKMGIDIFDQNAWPQILAMLDSNEWRKWRTAPGTISAKPVREYVGVREGWKKG